MGSTAEGAILTTISGGAELGSNVLNTSFATTGAVNNWNHLVAAVSTDGSSQTAFNVPSSASGVLIIPVNSTNPFPMRLRQSTSTVQIGTPLSSRWPSLIGVARSTSTGTTGVSMYLHTTSTGSSGVSVRVGVL